MSNRWTIIGPAEPRITPACKRRMVTAKCRCGYVATIDPAAIILGRSKSCGCLRDEMARARMLGSKRKR